MPKWDGRERCWYESVQQHDPSSCVQRSCCAQVKTRDGFVVTAPNVVLATNPPIHHNMTIHARLNPQRTYAVGLKMPEVR